MAVFGAFSQHIERRIDPAGTIDTIAGTGDPPTTGKVAVTSDLTNARVATTDLGALRSEVDATVRKVEQLVDELNRKWPFARDTELKLR